ncbi:MAG TPA: cupin domain-containing protein [Thermoanaerobaculia bacterium]
MTTALERLLEPIGRDEFRERVYGNEPLLIRATPGKFDGFFGWDDLNRVLNASPWPHPDVQMPPTYASPASAAAVIEQCRAGGALIFNQLDRYDAKVGAFTRALEAETGEPSNAVLFLSQPGQAAAPLHYDSNDVFVVHLEGRKAWAVYARTVEKPTHGMDAEHEPPAEPLFECELGPGDVLYMPRGYWHRALAQGGVAFHITFGVNARTGITFLTWLRDELRADPRFRRELPLTFSDETLEVREARLRGEMAALESLLVEKLRDPATVRAFIEHCVIAETDARSFKFPAQFLDRPAAELRRFSRAPHQRFLLGESNDGKFSLSVWGNLFYFPNAARPLIEFVFSRTQFTYDEALAHADGLPEQSVADLLNALVREGIVEG